MFRRIILAIPLLLWARYVRKPSSEKREPHHWLVEEEDDGSGKHKRRRRKKKRDHRPRNPTLAETGGLPPEKPGNPPAQGA